MFFFSVIQEQQSLNFLSINLSFVIYRILLIFNGDQLVIKYYKILLSDMLKKLDRELYTPLAKGLLLWVSQLQSTKIQSQGNGPLRGEPLF